MCMTVQEMLSKLVSFPVLGGMSNRPIITFIQDYLTSLGVESHLVEKGTEDKAALHCRIGPESDGGVILSGHTDVVPVAGQDWHSDPWTLTERDGKLYARGSADMKGFIACCLASVPMFLQSNLSRPIYFAFSYDEEIGCLSGDIIAEAIRDYYTERPAYAVIGEPSMMQPIVGQKGIVIYKTTVNGSAGHSSRIRQEVSAIHEAAKMIRWLDEKMNDLVARGDVDERFHPPHTSIHVGTLSESGIAPNVIAEECTFEWDIRVIPKNNSQDIYQEFLAYADKLEKEGKKRFPDFKIVTEEVHRDVPPLDTPESLPVVPWIKKLSGVDTVDTVAYAAEAGQFSLAGFETVICGPGDIAQAHRANEFISIDQLEKGMDFMRRLAADLS